MTRNKLGRRRFLQSAGSGLAGLTLLTKFPTRVDAQTASRTRIYPLNHNWLYREQAQPNATAAAFNDAGFKRVTIPHTNKLLPWHGFDDNEYEFVSIYRRHFRLPAETKDARVLVDFGGVMTAATVWINDQRLGEYRGGYTAGARLITTRTRIFAPAIVFAITASPTSFGFRNRPLVFTSRNVIRKRRSCWSPRLIGRAAIATRASTSR